MWVPSGRCLQSITQSAIRQLFQTVRRDRRPRRIAYQAFKSFAILPANTHTRMNTESGRHGAARSMTFETFFMKFSSRFYFLSGIGTKRKPSRDGSPVEVGHCRFLPLRDAISLLQHRRHSYGHAAGNRRHVRCVR